MKKLIVGTYGRKTHSAVLRALHGHEGFRFVRSTRRVFHHKLFLFEDPDHRNWAAIMGSANFTYASFLREDESAVLLEYEHGGGQRQS